MAPTLRWPRDPDEPEEDEAITPRARNVALQQTRALLDRAGALWATSSCPRTAECCHRAVHQRPPWLWPTEWALLAQHLRERGRPVPPPRADGACRLLDDAGRACTVYSARPFGCRTFFCEKRVGPKEPADATNELLTELAGLNIALDSQAAPRPLDEWLTAAAKTTK